MTLVDGKTLSDRLLDRIAVEVDTMYATGASRPPHLVAVLVGDDSASETYVAAKMRACDRCHYRSTTVRLAGDVSRHELMATIARLNADDNVDGFIVQLPLPAHLNEQEVIEAIAPSKDVDGFHPMNVGRLMAGMPCFAGSTPQGIVALIEHYGIATSGRHCVVVGRGNIVGKPVAAMLMQKRRPGNCTVTVCHSGTVDLARYTRTADILITAVGQPGLITGDMVRDGVAVFDVGITRHRSSQSPSGWKLLGDVDFDSVAPRASYITPVPGGVGPMTVASLMRNTLLAAQHKIYPR